MADFNNEISKEQKDEMIVLLANINRSKELIQQKLKKMLYYKIKDI